jgi:alkanesulfonate monooxygenase SsuD/methylene tetrahydromethanopterin reductase-like flavin-dependent oxidoreductase (luciferase family)
MTTGAPRGYTLCMMTMRFAMRQAPGAEAATRADLYATATEMARWGEDHGCMSLVVSEHHAADDGYLPSPVVLASAFAAVTERTPIMVAALLVLFYDPIRLAEDLAVLDIVSRGRVAYTVGLGYRPEEFEQFGVDMRTRGATIERAIRTLQQAWTGEPFTHEDRRVRVTPAPFTPGGPALLYGGGTAAAARRAARLGLAFLAEKHDPELERAYDEEASRAGVAPVGCMIPPADSTTHFVADDPDRAWAELGPSMLNDTRAYAKWNEGRSGVAMITSANTVDELRGSGAFTILTPDEAAAHVASGGMLMLQPLVGGLAPDVAWPYLELAARALAADRTPAR